MSARAYCLPSPSASILNCKTSPPNGRAYVGFAETERDREPHLVPHVAECPRPCRIGDVGAHAFNVRRFNNVAARVCQ